MPGHARSGRTTRRGVRLAVCALLASGMLLVPVSTARAVSTQPPTPVAGGQPLSAGHRVLDFSGSFQNATPLPTVSNPDPTVCLPEFCQQWSLNVRTSSPFLASIRNTNQSIDDGLNLYVYDPAGNQVGSSTGVGSDGQAVAIHPDQLGTYRLVVTLTYAYDTDVAYQGEARIMTPPSWDVPSCATSAPCQVLPALQPQKPSDVHVSGVPPVASTPLGFPFPVDLGSPNSCYLDETANTGATRCLRFTSEVDNVGFGDLELRIPLVTTEGGQPGSGYIPGECQAQQVITMSDGSTTTRPAGACEFHDTHGHFHYKDFVAYTLHSVNADGTTGPVVATSLKESFCLADDGYPGFGTAGPNGPHTWAGQPDCNIPGTDPASSDTASVSEGVNPGWGDIYTWDTPDQYIDISNTPPGTYDIVAQANPDGKLLVSGPTSPSATTRIALTATGVSVIG